MRIPPPMRLRAFSLAAAPPSSSGALGNASNGRRKGLGARVWVPILIVGVALAIGLELLNGINEQASSSPMLLVSMLITTVPLLLMIVIALVLVLFRGKPRRKRV